MNFEHNTINHEIELVSGVYRFKSLIWGAGRHYQKSNKQRGKIHTFIYLNLLSEVFLVQSLGCIAPLDEPNNVPIT